MKIPVILPAITIDFLDYEDEVRAKILAEKLSWKLHQPEWNKKLHELVQEAAQECVDEISKGFFDPTRKEYKEPT